MGENPVAKTLGVNDGSKLWGKIFGMKILGENLGGKKGGKNGGKPQTVTSPEGDQKKRRKKTFFSRRF